MAECYSVAVIEDKKVYYVGTQSSARSILRLLIEKEIGEKSFVFYHDGGWCEDKYEDELAFEKVSYDFIKQEDIAFTEVNTLTKDEFSAFYENFIGEETNRDKVDAILRQVR